MIRKVCIVGCGAIGSLYAAHLARENEWGFSHGASDWPGGSGTVSIEEFNGSSGGLPSISINPAGIILPVLTNFGANCAASKSDTIPAVIRPIMAC